jgi:excisionase family DNA binding protein
MSATPECRQLERSTASKPSTPALALSVEQACEALGVSWDTWHASIEPDVKIVRLGRRKLIPVAELERWLDEHAETALGGQ